MAGLINVDGPLTHEKMVNNIMEMHDIAHTQPGVVKAGRRWYQDAHNQTKQWANTYGMTHRTVTGIAAAVAGQALGLQPGYGPLLHPGAEQGRER